MKTIRTIICDDEQPARNRIRKLLEKETDVTILAEAGTGVEALELIKRLKPDLIFLDIQMPDMDGIQVIEKLTKDQLPHVIFSTAFNQYAIKAFDLLALDYLLKPFDNQRFKQALNRVRTEFDKQERLAFSSQLMKLVDTYKSDSNAYSITIHESGFDTTVLAKDIVYVQSYSNYLKIYTADNSFLYRASFDQFMEECHYPQFMRVHRSYLINLDFIEQISYLTNHEYLIKLITDVEIKSGRHFYQDIHNYLSKSTS